MHLADHRPLGMFVRGLAAHGSAIHRPPQSAAGFGDSASDDPRGHFPGRGVMTGQAPRRIQFAPAKLDLFGVGVSATDYNQTVAWASEKATRREPGIIDLMPVHGLIETVRDEELQKRIRQIDIVAPDGQAVRWALNKFYQTGLTDRVYGPELMLRICRAAEAGRIGIYLYGSSPEVIQKLEQNLKRRFPLLSIV